MNPPTSFSIYPLGDSAITIDLGNYIDEQLNRRALALYDWLQTRRFPGIIDIIVAYSSVSVFYDPALVHDSGFLRDWLQKAWQETGGADPVGPSDEGRLVRIPVCYEGEYAPEQRQRGLPQNTIRVLHVTIPPNFF